MEKIEVVKQGMSDKPFLKMLQGGRVSGVPFWFMRQAGRYLPEYRELRASKNGFMDMAMDPKAAAEVTVQPIRRYGMDAAIIFSDILTVPYALGMDLDFVAGEGPKLGPLDIQALEFDEQALDPVYDALRETSSQLRHEGFNQTALIGFSGAPWTVATYMVEGGSSRDFIKTKTMAYAQPDLFAQMIDKIVEATGEYLIKQIDAGAEAVQIFDSWAGALDPEQFVLWSIEPTKKIVERVRSVHPDVPVIGFPKGAGQNYERYVRETGITAVGLDTSMPTKWAAEHLQPHLPVQGNLDPLCLLAGGLAMEDAAKRILDDLSGGAFIFNLGHGINKDTPPAHVEALVKIIRDY